jgi:hypothetical protein
MEFIPRSVAGRLRRLLRSFPAVLVCGPRQCGKSTLVRSLYPGWTHLDLDRPADLFARQADLEASSRAVRGGSLSTRRNVCQCSRSSGTRSTVHRQRAASSSPAQQAGSAGIDFGVARRADRPPGTDALPVLRGVGHPAAGRWFWGGAPSPRAAGPPRAGQWLDSYVSTFLGATVLRGPAADAPARTLWTMLTHVHEVCCVSDLARSLGVSSTVASDLDVLEATLVRLATVPRTSKRLTRARSCTRDTGLLHFLAGLRHPRARDVGSSRQLLQPGHRDSLPGPRSVWSARDLLLAHRPAPGGSPDRRRAPYHSHRVKLGAAVDPRSLASLRQCMADLFAERGFVVTTGTERRSLGRAIESCRGRRSPAAR